MITQATADRCDGSLLMLESAQGQRISICADGDDRQHRSGCGMPTD
ncbi:hypothetical protein ACT691_08085 [Vibrio metschnikovii]